MARMRAGRAVLGLVAVFLAGLSSLTYYSIQQTEAKTPGRSVRDVVNEYTSLKWVCTCDRIPLA